MADLLIIAGEASACGPFKMKILDSFPIQQLLLYVAIYLIISISMQYHISYNSIYIYIFYTHVLSHAHMHTRIYIYMLVRHCSEFAHCSFFVAAAAIAAVGVVCVLGGIAAAVIKRRGLWCCHYCCCRRCEFECPMWSYRLYLLGFLTGFTSLNLAYFMDIYCHFLLGKWWPMMALRSGAFGGPEDAESNPTFNGNGWSLLTYVSGDGYDTMKLFLVWSWANNSARSV